MKIVNCHRCGKELRTDDYNTDGKVYYCQRCAPIVRQEEWNAQHGLESMTTDKDGNVVRKYRDGRTTVHTPAQVKRSFWRTIIILILLAAGVFAGIKYYSYSKNESNLLAPFEITQAESGDGSFVINTALSGSSTYKICELTVSPEKKGFISSIFGSSSDCAKTSNFTVNGKTVYRYYFSGYDFGTGLDGEFYLTEINGKRAILSVESRAEIITAEIVAVDCFTVHRKI